MGVTLFLKKKNLTTFLSLLLPLPSSHVVYPAFFLNSATKKLILVWCHPAPMEGVTLGGPPPPSDATGGHGDEDDSCETSKIAAKQNKKELDINAHRHRTTFETIKHLLSKSKVKVKKGIAVCRLTATELTCHMGSHSVTCHPAEVTFLPLPQPKLVYSI